MDNISPDQVEVLPPAFIDLNPNQLPIEMDSLCMNCHKQGTTRMLLTKIPFFREVMISRFECPHCGYSDNAIQFAGEFPSKGVRFVLHVTSPEDLNRRIIKSGTGVIRIPQINLEIPGKTQADSINTIEGVLDRCYEGVKESVQTPEVVEFLDNLEQCKKGLVQFDFVLDDPSGNSFIENPTAPKIDPSLEVSFYHRTPEMNEEIGLLNVPKTDEFNVENIDVKSIDHFRSVFSTDQPVSTFPTSCPVCSTDGESRSCTLSIPYFKEIVIMAFSCENCGYHNGEVMVGGSMSLKGKKITLKCDSSSDLDRELLKSEMSAVNIPEINLRLIPGTLGGKFTTVEGLIRDIHGQLSKENPFMKGDSALEENSGQFQITLKALMEYAEGQSPFTLEIDDPLANSFIQPLSDNDPKLIIEEYERSIEQNEELGINDMIVDDFNGQEELKKRLEQEEKNE